MLTTCSPQLLIPVDGAVPARALVDELAGEPAALRVEGDWAGVAPAPEVARFLREVVALTVAVAPVGTDVGGACDLTTDDPAEADTWLSGFSRAPRAAVAAALLARRSDDDTWDGLVAESTTYSMLQAGPEFAAWRAGARPAAAHDDGPRIRVHREGNVCEIVLARGHRHNALDVRTRDELHAALLPLLDERDTVVAVRADGPSFCSGGDLGEFGTAPAPPDAHLVRLSRSLALLFATLAPRLVVGVHGACLGAGIELAAFARHVIAAHDALIGLPELGLGLVPGAGGTVSIRRRAGRQHLLALLLDGRPIDAATARAWGLVDEIVPQEELPVRLRRVAASL